LQNLELPRWLLLVGSGAICFHFFALLMVAIAVRSGPWWVPEFGPTDMEPPQFAQPFSNWAGRYYLQPLQMAHNYHFSSNRTDISAVYFEAKLKDAKGKVVQTLRFPEANQSFWIRERQRSLAQNLGEDERVEPPRGDVIPAPGKKVREIEVWKAPEGQTVLQLQKEKEYLIPRGPGAPQVFSPSEWSKALARSYALYLCRIHGASAVELIRHSREPLYPGLMFMREPPPPQTYEELICSYGEYRLEK
jgi:hypothetical protein